MLKRLEFKDHEIDLAVVVEHILYVSLDDEMQNEGVVANYTTIYFKEGTALKVVGKHFKDKLRVTKLHTEILNKLFA